MKKKIQLLLLTLVITGLFTGCSALLFDTYYSEKDFQGNQSIDLDADVQLVHNYAELRRLVFDMMNNHEESTALRFAGYTGNVVSDIASVCNAVKTESAYGSYCVDYISYDLTQIVSYYEAYIDISYKFTQEELQLLKTTNNHESFSELLARELALESPNVIVRVNNGVSDHAAVTALIEQTMREHPLSLSYKPDFAVKIFTGNSSQKIYEVTIDYDEELNNTKRISELNDTINQIILSVVGEDAKKALDAAEILITNCRYDRLGGETAYDALIQQSANSEGIASAFKAVCDHINIECQIVNGKLDREEHYWNIVRIENEYYHFDVSALEERGGARALFQSDAEQQINYWWDQSIYPDCEGNLTYLAVNSK